MNLDTFEDQVEPVTILSRGLSYYREGSVLSLEMAEAGHYRALVAGTQLYTVKLTLDDDREVREMYCTCPYDWGEYCKHEVAVLYALRHHLKRDQHEMVERPKDVDLEALLENKSKKELLSFLLDYAKKNPDAASALVLAFPSPVEEVNFTNLGIEFRHACEHGIESLSEEDEYGWGDEEDDWQFTSKLNMKIAGLLKMAHAAFLEGNIRYGGQIVSMMVHEVSALDEYESESLSEDVAVFIMQVTALFDDIKLNEGDVSWLFSLFFAEADGYEFSLQVALLRLCLRLAETESDQAVLKNYLVALATEQPEEKWGINTTILNSLELQYALLLKQKRGEDAQALALANLFYEEMRKLAFDHALESKDYCLAEKLAKEKEGSGFTPRGGIDWSVLLFKVYQESGNQKEMRSLAKIFLLHGDIAYYPILKASYEEREWKAILDGLLDDLQARDEGNFSSAHRKNPYAEVLKAEGKHGRLLAYLQKNPRMVRAFQDVLLPHYKDEVFALYKQVILKDGEAATGRDEYKAMASWLGELVSLGGRAVAKECMGLLAPRYKQRPAMRDELKKAGVLE